MTLGADGEASAAESATAAAALTAEAFATRAAQAARRGDFKAVRYLLEQALLAIAEKGGS